MGRRAGDERETRAHNAGDDRKRRSPKQNKKKNAGDEGETVSPETSFRHRETSSARLPLSPRTLTWSSFFEIKLQGAPSILQAERVRTHWE